LIRADEGRILRRLLYLQIGADLVQDQISQYANINTQPNIGMGQIENLQIAVPPLGKQRAIADFLDRKTKAIDVLIQKKERLIELLQEKRQVLITQAVTKGFNPTVPMKDSGIEWLGEIPAHWNLHRVKHLVSFITSGSRGWAEYFSDEGPIFLQSGNLDRHLGLDLSNIQHVQPPKGAEGTRTRVRRDDVLVCITGALTGNVSHVHSDVGEAYVNQHLALVRPKSTLIHPWLLAHALASDFGQHQFWVTQYGGTKQGLGLQDVRDVVLPVPPPAEQTDLLAKLETRLSALTRLRTRIDHQVSRLREYRQVLISAAVTGKIDVTKETAC